jgi:hypothetical protein
MKKWMLENENNFRASERTYIPNPELIRFAELHIGGDSINALYKSGRLPDAVKNLIYPLLRGEEVTVKWLRSKLIIFGFCYNMNEDEIDIMLEMAKLTPLSDPVSETTKISKMDTAIVLALRCAHETYPYYSLGNAKKVLGAMDDKERGPLRDLYEEQKRSAVEFSKEYEKKEKTPSDITFEERYTDYNDKGLIHYMRDVLAVLAKRGSLDEKEASEFLSFMRIKGIEEEE